MVSVHKQTDVSWWLHHIYLAARQADEVQQAVLALARLTFSHNASNEVSHHPQTSTPMVVLFLSHVFSKTVMSAEPTAALFTPPSYFSINANRLDKSQAFLS